MLSKNFKNALRIITQRMDEYQIEWALIGSTNCALQGMNLTPNDLDIVVRLKDLKRMNKVFKDYKTSPVKELSPLGFSNKPAWEVKIEIDDLAIQVLGEEDAGKYVSKLVDRRIKEIKVEDLFIPCLTLEAETEAYEEADRPEKAKRIRKFLEV